MSVQLIRVKVNGNILELDFVWNGRKLSHDEIDLTHYFSVTGNLDIHLYQLTAFAYMFRNRHPWVIGGADWVMQAVNQWYGSHVNFVHASGVRDGSSVLAAVRDLRFSAENLNPGEGALLFNRAKYGDDTLGYRVPANAWAKSILSEPGTQFYLDGSARPLTEEEKEQLVEPLMVALLVCYLDKTQTQ